MNNDQKRRRTNMNGMGFPSWEEIVRYKVDLRSCQCGRKYVPTPKSPESCLMCKSGSARIRR